MSAQSAPNRVTQKEFLSKKGKKPALKAKGKKKAGKKTDRKS